MSDARTRFVLPRQDFDAVIFDMDGVVTDTAMLHGESWKKMFDGFLQGYAGEAGPQQPFDLDRDYRLHVDGLDSQNLGIDGKPDPAIFLQAARAIGVEPGRAVVVDAISGVQAGRTGGFGLVIGVDRVGDPEALRSNGADVVVADLAEVTVSAA